MKKLLLALLSVILLSLVVIAGSSSVVSAVPSCTGWMKQTDGSYFRTCVDDKGTQYCESKKNGRISRVRCS